MEFKLRLDDLEARSCGDHLLSDPPHNTIEIVKWEDATHCYVVAYFVKHSKGYDLKSVSGRIFDVDMHQFMILAKISYDLLEKIFLEEIVGE